MPELKDVYDKIYRYCFYKIRNSTAAEDITQEAFLRYFAHNTSLKGGKDTAYLFTIAKNLCTDFFRRKKTEELTEDYSCEDFSDCTETKIAVRTALEKISNEQREVLVLRYLSELSVSVTARLMGISRFAVYRLEKTAFAEMKKHLKGAYL